jgi:uncharacterized membrane protein
VGATGPPPPLLIFWKDRERRALLGRWLLAQAAVVLALVPWLVFASGLLGSHTSGWIKSTTALKMVQRSLLTFSLGSTISPSPGMAFSAVMGVLFLLGCFLPSRPVGSAIRFSGRALVLLYLAVPVFSPYPVVASPRRRKVSIGCVACY